MATATALAAEAPAGSAALKQARAAWERGALDAAEPLYREAIEKGGLGPSEILEGYVRIGAIRASLGKKDQAIAAFRAASILDASFAVPSEAGPKGAPLAERAKRNTAKIGSIHLTLEAPKEAAPGKSFHVTAKLDAAHVAIVTKVALLARDGTSGREATLDAKTEDTVDFEIPAELTLPNASVFVRVDALDRNNNRLASAEERVRIPDAGPATAGGAGSGPAAGAAAKASPGAPTSAGASQGRGATPSSDASSQKSGGFWSSPWPYVLGGVALAGAGTAVFLGTRPSEDVTIGQVGVRAR